MLAMHGWLFVFNSSDIMFLLVLLSSVIGKFWCNYTGRSLNTLSAGYLLNQSIWKSEIVQPLWFRGVLCIARSVSQPR